jgi:hypothetical protein
VAVELQGQLLARERELDSREGVVVMWEEGLAAFACMLGEVCVECNACHVCASAVQWDFFAQVHASSSRSKQLTDLARMLEERQILLSLQEMDLEVREAILAEELERNLHSSDGRDLSPELDKARALADGKHVHSRMGSPTSALSRQCDYHSASRGFPMAWSTWACCPSRTFPNSRSRLKKAYRWLISS